MIVVVAILVGLVATVLGATWLYGRLRGPARPEADVWAEHHGLELTSASRPWVTAYLRTGRDLRQIGAFGGLIVAVSIHAATGLDLHVSGLVWLLIGYLIGGLWAELAMTRVPSGAQRMASLVPRRLADYLPRRLRVAQVVLPAMAAVLGRVCVRALRATSHDEARLAAQAHATGSSVALQPHSAHQLLQSGAVAAATIAPLIMVAVWLAQRYIVARPQPSLDPGLVAADDVLRTASVYLLSASGLAAVSLLIAGQFGYLTTVTGWFWLDVSRLGAAVSLIGALMIFHRWRHGPSRTLRTVGGGPDLTRVSDEGPSSSATFDGWLPAGATATMMATADPVDVRREAEAWTVRRRPVVLAVALVVLVALAGWGLRTWGVVNPAVTVSASFGSPGTVGVNHWQATVAVYNEAATSMTIEWIDAEPISAMSGWLDGSPPPLPQVIGVTAAPPSAPHAATSPDGRDRALPVEVPGGTTATLNVELALSDCDSSASVAPIQLVVHYRSRIGRASETRAPNGSQQLGQCVAPLPTGAQPADVTVAESEVRAAFTTAYDPSAVDRIDLIDDRRGVAEATAQAEAGPYAAEVASTWGTVDEVSFDRPDHAWVRYQLTNIGGVRVGEARLIDGHWKVARSTVCADLALAQAICAPLPG